MIHWESFDWPTFGALAQAASGLLVGLVAVWGAVKVGNRQSAILARQVELERTKLDHDLYERRFRSYEVAYSFIDAALRRQYPLDIRNDYVRVLNEANFLFTYSTVENIKEIWTKVHDSSALADSMDSKPVGSPERSEESQKLLDVTLWLDKKLRTLHDDFPELKLSAKLIEAS